MTINDVCASLAKKNKATIGCPMTIGIFAWVAAHAAEKRERNGEKDITVYWRSLKTGGVLNEKYPGDAEVKKLRLEQKGHTVTKKSKNYTMLKYEKVLIQI